MSVFEEKIIAYINEKVSKGNIDNISRTEYYKDFYADNPEIEWSFLASMVSRNAGWNMCDLEGKWLSQVLPPSLRHQMFLTYERANWLIFLDAFPQLLLHELSKKYQRSLFHLLRYFHVSKFMQKEWQTFWKTKDRNRLMTALIINEQNVIQKPVVEHPFYERRVFKSLPYKIQDWMHYSCVLFPTITGELYGFSVHDFSNVNERIRLGKKLAWLLFHPKYYTQFKLFSDQTVHTGSRHDYQQYFYKKTLRETPFLRVAYPIIRHHRDYNMDWYRGCIRTKRWFRTIRAPKKYHLTKWYKKKQKHLHAGIKMATFVVENKK